MMDVIVFSKTKEDRLKEFTDVLCPDDVHKVLATSVAAQWSFHLELTVEPIGWQALWKIPRQTCNKYSLRFPTVVFVEVENVDFENFTALVKILKVQDSIDIPTKHEVDLKNLHPTQHQENAVDAKGIANVLDKLRFFYNHLWRPWDCDDSENEDWLSNYLEPRLQLYYDMLQGLLSRETAERISKLFADGREIYSQKSELENRLDEGMEADDDHDDDDAFSSESAEVAYALLQLHKKLEPIKTELRFLENPAMRVLVEQKIAQKTEIEKREPGKFVVSNSQTLGSYMEFLSCVEKLLGSIPAVKPIYCLQAGLETAQAGDTMVLSPGVHQISGIGRLEEGGWIIGVDEKRSAVLRRPSASNIFLDVGSGRLAVQNVQVDCDNVDVAFLVRPRGSLELTNVQLGSPATAPPATAPPATAPPATAKCAVAVEVLPGGRLHLDKCEIQGCHVGVFCHPGGSVFMSSSVISGCSVGLQVKQFGKTQVKIEDSVISDCRNVAIDVIDSSLSASGSVDILKDVTGFTCSNFKTKANNADVVIQQHHTVLEENEPGCL